MPSLKETTSKHEQYTAIAWIKGRVEVNRALQANILAKYELNVSTMPRRYVRKRVAAWSTEGTWILFRRKNSASRLPQNNHDFIITQVKNVDFKQNRLWYQIEGLVGICSMGFTISKTALSCHSNYMTAKLIPI